MRGEGMDYTIGEFADLFAIQPYTLRFYEQQHILEPQRDENNRRVYNEWHKEWMRFIFHLKRTGMTIEEIRKYVDLRSIGESTVKERYNMLKRRQIELKSEIKDQLASLTVLDEKVAYYERVMAGKGEQFELSPDALLYNNYHI